MLWNFDVSDEKEDLKRNYFVKHVEIISDKFN
jgi:hypothetical protein